LGKADWQFEDSIRDIGTNGSYLYYRCRQSYHVM